MDDDSKFITFLKVLFCLWLIKWLFENCKGAMLVIGFGGLLVCGIGWTVEKVQLHFAANRMEEWAVTSAAAATTACTKSGGEPKWCGCVFSYLYVQGGYPSQKSIRQLQENPDSTFHGRFPDLVITSANKRCSG